MPEGRGRKKEKPSLGTPWGGKGAREMENRRGRLRMLWGGKGEKESRSGSCEIMLEESVLRPELL